MTTTAYNPLAIPGFDSDPLAQAAATSRKRVEALLATGSAASSSRAHLIAAASGDLDTFELLVENGADLCGCDGDLRTAFELAHRFERYAVVRYLQQFEQDDLCNEEGTPRWLCPICWHWQFIGTSEDACEHYLTSTDMSGQSFQFAEFEEAAQRLAETVDGLLEGGLELRLKVESSRSNAAEVVRNVLDCESWLFWNETYAHFIDRITVDVSGDTTYTDYFTRSPNVLGEQIERDCKGALRWLESLRE